MSMNYDHLSGLDQRIAETGARPRLAVYFATGLAVLIGWLWVLFLTAGASQFSPISTLGPGMALLQPLLDWIGDAASQSSVLEAFIRFCTPQVSEASPLIGFASMFLMWLAMSVAMMLPSAAPMLRTYGDIAHTAKEKGENTIPLYVLAIGYLTTWTIFAFAAALLQILFIRFGLLQTPIGAVHGVVGGAMLIIAGLYQFSALKNACLEKCRNPFTTLFSQWSTTRAGVFKLGAEQGVFCIGCCWALMLVMFVVGTMNLAWMAFFTLFAIVEKSGSGKVTSGLSGVILLVWGGILLSVSAMSV